MPKDFLYRGLTEEELRTASMDEFIRMLPSRMRRSLRRGISERQRILIEKMRNWAPTRSRSRPMPETSSSCPR